MIIELFVVSLLIGFIRRGNLHNLGQMPIRYPYLFILPLALFAAVCSMAMGRGDSSLYPYVKIANVVQYVGLLVAIVLNLHIREMWAIGVGVFSNFLAIAVNKGMMPMSESAIRSAGLDGMLDPGMHFVRHSILDADTRLKFLVDIIPVGPFTFLPEKLAYVLKEVASIGDVVIALAVFVMVQRYMCPPRKERAK